MARAPDPHNLRNLAKKAAPAIDVDRECAGCGYNLRGLRYGVVCPECGMPSTAPPGIDDPLSVMPMRIILALVRGCWVASICVVLMVAVVLAERFGALDARIAMTILTVLSMVWVGAVVWLTPVFSLPEAVSRGFGYRSPLRSAGRWLQVGWVVATGFTALRASVNAPAPVEGLLWLGTIVGLMAGLSGLVALSILMERLADWARDEDAQRMFNWAAWSWPLAMLVFVPVQAIAGSWIGTGGQYRWGAGLFILLWLLAIGTFPYGLLMLAKSVTLSILHNIEYQGRTERKLERDRRYFERAGERAARTEPHPMKGMKGK